MAFDWIAFFDELERARTSDERRAVLAAACARLPPERSATAWRDAIDALGDERRKRHVAALLSHANKVPDALFAPMIRAGVYEVNPSFNRAYIAPCVRARGRRAVVEALFGYFESGTDFEKAGAVNAMYWAAFPMRLHALSPRADEDMVDLEERARDQFLREFVRNESVPVRRSLMARISWRAEDYPEGLSALVAEALAIARAHPDEYIRHRLAVELGESRTFPALPHRG